MVLAVVPVGGLVEQIDIVAALAATLVQVVVDDGVAHFLVRIQQSIGDAVGGGSHEHQVGHEHSNISRPSLCRHNQREDDNQKQPCCPRHNGKVIVFHKFRILLQSYE